MRIETFYGGLEFSVVLNIKLSFDLVVLDLNSAPHCGRRTFINVFIKMYYCLLFVKNAKLF